MSENISKNAFQQTQILYFLPRKTHFSNPLRNVSKIHPAPQHQIQAGYKVNKSTLLITAKVTSCGKYSINQYENHHHYSPQGKRIIGRPKKHWREQL
jgi:hypothetical protein